MKEGLEVKPFPVLGARGLDAFGQGTTFDLYWPRSAWIAADEGVEEAFPRGQERILFVDDGAPFVRLAQPMLVRLGCEVLACTSGAEALAAFQVAPQEFDLVITD